MMGAKELHTNLIGRVSIRNSPCLPASEPRLENEKPPLARAESGVDGREESVSLPVADSANFSL